MGRVTTVTPPAQMTPVTFGFFSRTGLGSDNKLTVTRGEGPSQTITEYFFDHLGRMTSQMVDTAAGRAETTYAYTADGKLAAETLPGGLPGQPRTIKHDYDVLEREDETHWRRFERNGVHLLCRPWNADENKGRFGRQRSDVYGGNLTTALDSFGRLRLANDDIARAVYEYDVLSNSTKATLNTVGGGGGTQKREFNYDGRGFVLSESNPELHDSLGQVKIKYTADSRGHVLTRRYVWEGGTPPSPSLNMSAYDLEDVYDRAERISSVSRSRDAARELDLRPLKLYQYYDMTSAAGQRNQLQSVERYNYFNDPNATNGIDTYKVLTAYSYCADQEPCKGLLANTTTNVYGLDPSGQNNRSSAAPQTIGTIRAGICRRSVIRPCSTHRSERSSTSMPRKYQPYHRQRRNGAPRRNAV